MTATHGSGGSLRCPTLIGRADLVERAGRQVTGAAGGSGGLLFLAGEAGIGKTRLLTEIRRMAVDQGFRIIEASAYPQDTEVSGGVLIDLAAALTSQPVTADLGHRMVRRIADLDGGEGDASHRRRMLITDLAGLIVALGGEAGRDGGPVMLALEDMHWADDLTVEVLGRTARRLAAVSLLVVGTYRSDELYPRTPMLAWRSRLLTQRLAEEIRLARLSPAETAGMATAITGSVLPTTVISTVQERSDGIPLHVEEFLTFIARQDGPRDQVPDTLTDAVLSRARALSEPARRIADAASAIGRSFEVDLLRAVTGAGPEAIDGALRELAERFIATPGDDASYHFRHALVRDVLYRDLTPNRRRDLHVRIADAAAAAGFTDAFLSDQYERAQQPGPAYRHAMSAAANAVAMSAHREAVGLYRRAQRMMTVQIPPAEHAALLTALAAELAATDDNAAAASTYAEAYTMLRGLGDDAAAAALVPPLAAARHLLGADLFEREGLLREALELVGEPDDTSGRHTRARLLAAVSAAYMLDRCLDESVAVGREAKALAGLVGDEATNLYTDVTLGVALVFAGRMAEGWRLLETVIHSTRDAKLEEETARGYRMLGSSASALVEYDRARRWLRDGIGYAARTERFNDCHYMTAHLAHTLWASGDWREAAAQADRALADGGRAVTTRITALHVHGYLAVGRGDWPAAEGLLHEARELGERMAEMQRLSPALWGLAEMSLRKGQPDAAVDWCERGYTASSPAWDAAYLYPFVVTGVRAYLAVDSPTAARDWLARCEQFLTYRSIPGTMPALAHGRGLLHLADGHTGRARAALTAASAGWDTGKRFWEGTQAIHDRAVAANRSRRAGEATRLYEEAERRAEAVGATVLCTGRDPDRATTDDTPQPLTAREIEVARLIATGGTNRQIALALSISPKTVAAHVEHILTKLDAARRTEIAAWVTANTAGAAATEGN